MNNNTTPTVDAISRIHFEGHIVPHTWYKWITKEIKVRGQDKIEHRPYLEAIVILSDIVYWYRRTIIKDENTDQITGIKKKFRADKLQRSYSQLADHFGMGKDQARNAVKRLEALGLINLEFRNIHSAGQTLSNVLFIEPMPDEIAKISDPINIPYPLTSGEGMPKPKDTPIQTSGEGIGKPEETYTKTSSKISTKKHSLASESNFDLFEYTMVDETDSEIKCPNCDRDIIITRLSNARSQCPNCDLPIRIINWQGHTIKRPSQKARRKEQGYTDTLEGFDKKPLQGFCALYGIPYSGMPIAKQKQWARQMQKVAQEHDASADLTYSAIRGIKDSEHAWQKFKNPYQQGFIDLLDLMLMRQKAGHVPNIETQEQKQKASETLVRLSKRLGMTIEETKEYLKGFE